MPSHQLAADMTAVGRLSASSHTSIGPEPAVQKPSGDTKYGAGGLHITETPITRKNWYKHVSWLNVILIVGVPFAGLVMAWWSPLYPKTAAFAVAYYFATALGITAGYHRLWAEHFSAGPGPVPDQANDIT